MGRFISTGRRTSRGALRWPRKSKRCWTRKKKPQKRRRRKKSPRRSRRRNQTRRRNRRRRVAALSRVLSQEARGENTNFQLARVGFDSGGVLGNSGVDADRNTYLLCDQRRQGFHLGGTCD